MSFKTAPNKNLYLTPENEDGTLFDPSPLQTVRRVSDTLNGSYETIQNDTKLPGRNPSRNFKGTDSNAGDLVVNFAPIEYDKYLEAVLCSEAGFTKSDTLSDDSHDVYIMLPGNKQRTFSLLNEHTQSPKLYQLYKGLQFNTLNISFTIGALVKLTFGLMGKNNPILEDAPPISMNNILPAFKTKEFITLQGNWKFKGPNDDVPVEYIDGVDITLVISNNMEELKGLFQTEAIDKTLGMLNITGTINEYVKDGKLYNLAKQGKGGELYITVYSEEDDAEYTFKLQISFDNSTMSGDTQLQYALPFSTFGEERFSIQKKVKKEVIIEPDPIPVSSIFLNKNALSLEVGNSEILTATIQPDNADNKNVFWESDDPNIATVDQNGNVLAIDAGTATITIKADDNTTGVHLDTCDVTVTEE